MSKSNLTGVEVSVTALGVLFCCVCLIGGCKDKDKAKDETDPKKDKIEKQEKVEGDSAGSEGDKNAQSDRGHEEEEDPHTPIPTKDLPPVKKVLAEVEEAKKLKEVFSKPSKEFMDKALPKLQRWSDIVFGYTHAGKKDEADRLSQALSELQGHWGDELFPPDKFDAFSRDRFKVGPALVWAAQYFKPVPYHKGDKQIMKYYRFSLYLRKEVVGRYFLERSELKEPFFVLGLQSNDKHYQIKQYGSRKPTYWELKEAVIEDTKKKLQKVPKDSAKK